MEFAAGEPLEARLERERALSPGAAAGVLLQVLAALEAMHAAGVLHRDLKPSNVMLCPGPPERARLIDFGIARPLNTREERRYTRTGVMVGTPDYMAPEQLLGYPVDERTDVYAAGLVLYRLLAGHLPYPGDDLASVLRRVHEPIPFPVAPPGRPAVPEWMAGLVLEALSVDPARRPASARALARALRSAPDGQARPGAAPSGPLSPDRATPTRSNAATFVKPHAPTGERSLTEFTRGPAPLARVVLAARLPPSSLANPQDRRWLAGLLPTTARSFAFGRRHWIAILAAPDPQEANARAEAIRQALLGRLGETAASAWSPVDPQFAISAAMLSGAAALPQALQALMERLAADETG
jgi:serine/threonine protein kinase